MPRDLPTDVGQGADNDRKKKRRAAPATSPEPHYDPQPTYSPVRDPQTTAQRLTYIEQRTNSVLPSEVTWALGNARLDNKDLARASRYFAKQFDLPVNDFLNPVNGQDIKGLPLIRYEDPINGGLLTLRSARRLLEQAEPLMIQQWLEREPATRKNAGISSKNIIRVLNDLTPYVGESLNIGQAISIARGVVGAKTGKSFKQNLDVVMKSSLKNDPMMALAVAQDAAEKGTAFNDYTDVLGFLVGGEVEKGQIKTGVTIDPKTGLATVQDQDYVKLAQGVGNLPVLNDLYDALREKTASYSEEADKIMREMEHQQDHQSLFAKSIGLAFHGLELVNRPLDAFVRVFGDPDAWTGPMLALMGEEGAMEPFDTAMHDAKEILAGDASVYDLQRMKDLGWSSGEIITWQLALSIGLPAGASAKAFAEAGSFAGKAGAAALYAGEFALDPLTSGGKLARVAGGRKFLPFLNAADQVKVVDKWLNSGVKTELLNAAKASVEDGGDMFRKLVSHFKVSYGTDGIHPLTARSIQSFVEKGMKSGLDDATMERAIGDFLSDSLGMSVKNPLVNEIQEIAYNMQKDGLKKANLRLAEPIPEGEVLKIARRNAQALEDQLSRAAHEAELVGPIMHEVPHLRKLNGLRDSLHFGTGGGKVGSAVKAVGVAELPLRQGSYFHFIPDSDLSGAIDGLETVLTRSRVFGDDAGEWVQKFTNVARPGFPQRERMMGEVLGQIQDEMLSRISKEVGVPTNKMLEFVEEVFGDSSTGLKKYARGARGMSDIGDKVAYLSKHSEYGDEITRRVPIMQSQLQNAFQLIDPVHVRKAVKEHIGYVREVNAMMRRTLGKDASSFFAKERELQDKIIGLQSKVNETSIVAKRIAKAEKEELDRLDEQLASGVITNAEYDDLTEAIMRERVTRASAAVPGTPSQEAFSRLEKRLGEKGVTLDRKSTEVGKLTRAGLVTDDEAELLRHWKRGTPPPATEALAPAEKLTAAEGELAAALKDLKKLRSPEAYTVTPSRVIGELTRDVWRPLMGLIKFGWVARPAYVLRIVLGDELLRFMATEGAWNRIRSGRTATDVAARFEGMGLRKMLHSEGVLDTAQELAAEGRLSDDFASRFPGFLADEGEAGQGAVKIMANAQGDILPSDLQDALFDHWGGALRPDTPNKSKDAKFVGSWYRALFQTAQDEAMGQEILKHRLAGLNEEETIGEVLTFMKKNPLGKAEVERMKQEPLWNMDNAVREQTEYVYRLTPYKELAEQVADGSMTPELLASMDRNLWPAIVHGPAMNGAASKTNLLKRIGRSFGRAILETPTNKLIRQPFFKANYTRIYDFLTDQANAAGKEIDEQMDNALQAEARRFAIRRTQQIMFDFTRSGRIAEMAWFVSPFLQPFTEFFVAWPRIIKQNPAMLGYINRLGQAAHESGFFKEEDGQLVLPASNFMGAAPLIAAFTGTNMTGGPGGGWSLSMPVASFNMFTNSAYPVQIGGVDIPIPTPSFSPPAQWALQQFTDAMPMDQHVKEKMTAWLTEYGEVSAARPQDWALPTWLRHALEGAVPSWFEDTTNRNTNSFRAMQQAMGLEVNDEDAHWQAQQFSLWRAFVSAFFPASPQIKFPTQELDDEFDAMYKANPDTAYEDFVGVWNPDTHKFEGGRHPGLTLVAAGKSVWDDSRNPFSMPANQLAERILNSKGGKEFAAKYPEFVFFIIPKEIRDGEMDFGVFNDQIADGERKILSPEEQTASAEDRAAWTAAFSVREQWLAWQGAHPEQESGDPGYDARQGQFEDDIDEVAGFFPGWEGAAEIKLPTKVAPNVMLRLRQVVSSEEFATKTDMGQGLKAYFELRDGVAAEMAEKGISNLDTVTAERSGLTGKMADGVAAIIEAHPDFGLAYDTFQLDKDLINVRTAGEKTLDNVPQEVQDEVINPWWDKWETVKAAPYEGSVVLPAQKFAKYAAMRDYADTAYTYPDGQNPLKLWWGTQNPQEKTQYLVSVGGRDGIYWSRFDWEVMAKSSNNPKIAPTKVTAKFWDDVDKARSEAFQLDHTQPNYDLAENLELIDRGIVAGIKKSPKLRAQLEVMNTWAYGLRNSVLTGGEFPPVATKGTRKDWEQVFKAASDLQEFLGKEELTGNLYGEDKAYFNTVKDALGKWISKKQKQNKQFAKQWDYVQGFAGDLIIEQMMPDSWYPIGTVGDAPATLAPAGVAHVGGRKLVEDPKSGVKLIRPALASLEQAKEELKLPRLFSNVGGYRTAAEQEALYANRANNPNPVAPPGQSNHESGTAVDIDVAYLDAHPELVNWLRNNGWTNLAGDPPHWDWTG